MTSITAARSAFNALGAALTAQADAIRAMVLSPGDPAVIAAAEVASEDLRYAIARAQEFVSDQGTL